MSLHAIFGQGQMSEVAHVRPPFVIWCIDDFQILDESSRALSDVLLSLSGGKQYRSNNITKEDGTMVFTHLVCTFVPCIFSLLFRANINPGLILY